MGIRLARPASRISRSSSAGRRSAAFGERTPIRALRATCLPPVFVLVRPRIELVAPLRTTGGDLGLPRGGDRPLSGCGRTSASRGWRATEARFDPEAGRWTLNTDDGESHEFDVLVTACGQLTRPATPHVEGLGRLSRARSFHSAELGPPRTTWPARGSRWFGTGAFGDPVRAAGSRRAASELTIYQRFGAMDRAEGRPHLPGVGAARLRALPGAGGRVTPRALSRSSRSGTSRLHRPALGAAAVRGARRLLSQA